MIFFSFPLNFGCEMPELYFSLLELLCDELTGVIVLYLISCH